jgi:hypothetical protein
VVVDQAHRLAELVRRLQVIGEQLLVLDRPFVGGTLQPRREAFVQVGALFLGEHLVGGVPQERVVERERLAAQESGRFGRDEVTAR